MQLNPISNPEDTSCPPTRDGDCGGRLSPSLGPTYRRIGGFELEDTSSVKARELKNVVVDIECHYLKLLITDCFVNKYNLFNQVGIIAVTIEGS
jgi:centrosomal protein CEP104